VAIKVRSLLRFCVQYAGALLGVVGAAAGIGLAAAIHRGLFDAASLSWQPRLNLLLVAYVGSAGCFYAIVSNLLLNRQRERSADLRRRVRVTRKELDELKSRCRTQQQRIDALSMLREVAYLVNMESDFAIIAEKTLELVFGVLEPIEVTLFLVAQDKQTLTPFCQCVGSKALMGRKIQTKTIPDFTPSSFDRQGIVRRIHGQELHAIIPLRTEDEIPGVLFFVFPTDDRPDVRQMADFDARNGTVLHELARHISLAFKTKYLHTKAVMDGLTSLYTKSHFGKQLQAQVEMAQRKEGTFSLILLDIDHFKKVNDTYGHPVGDKVLSGVADLVRKTLRKYDSAYRVGGEEMAILLPRTDASRAERVAGRLKDRIERKAFKLEDGRKIAVTASLGVAQWTGTDTSDTVYGRADTGLYSAKDQGRNRVVVRAA